MRGTRQLSGSSYKHAQDDINNGGVSLTFIEARLAGEIQKGRDRGAEDVGVEDTGSNAAARK